MQKESNVLYVETVLHKKTFQLEYELNAKYEGTTEKIINHAMNADGIRDTARILKISPTTVIERLKQQADKLIQ